MKKFFIITLVIGGLIGAAYVWSRQPDELNLQVLVPQNQYWNQSAVTVSGVSFGADRTTVTVRIGDQVLETRILTSEEWSFVLAVPVREGNLTITALAEQMGWFIYQGKQAQQEVVFQVDQTPPMITAVASAATPDGLFVNGIVQDSYSGIREVLIVGYPTTVDGLTGFFSGYVPWETALLMSAITVRAVDNALNSSELPVNMQFPEEYAVVYSGNGVAVQASPTLGLECPMWDVYMKNYRCQFVSRRMMAESWIFRRFDPYPPMIAFTAAFGVVVTVILVVAWLKRRPGESLPEALPVPALAVAVAAGPSTAVVRRTQDALWQRLARRTGALPDDEKQRVNDFLRVNRNITDDAALVEAARTSNDEFLIALIEEVNHG